MSQSNDPENWAQFFLFPLIRAAGRRQGRTVDREGGVRHDVRGYDGNPQTSSNSFFHYFHICVDLEESQTAALSLLTYIFITWYFCYSLCKISFKIIQFVVIISFLCVCPCVYLVVGRGSWVWSSRPLLPPFLLPQQNELHCCRREDDRYTPAPGWSSPTDTEVVGF